MTGEKSIFNWRAPPDWFWRAVIFLLAVGALVLITTRWNGSDQFLPSALLQAVGQSFALSGVIFFGMLHLRPQDALTFASALQVSRLVGGELGTAFVVTFARKRIQIASNLLGQHLQIAVFKALGGGWRNTETAARR